MASKKSSKKAATPIPSKTTSASPSTAAPIIKYEVENYVYEVTATYKDDGKSVHEIMLDLMKKEAEKPFS